jgi:hypothetical protein
MYRHFIESSEENQAKPDPACTVPLEIRTGCPEGIYTMSYCNTSFFFFNYLDESERE